MTKHAFYSKTLPDPFLREDGSRVTEPSQWPEQAAYIRRLAQDCLYGQWPGKPYSLKASRVGSEIRYDGSLARLTEKVELTVNDDFMMEVEIHRPLLPRRIPAIVYNVSPAWMRVPDEDRITAAGYAIVLFDREAIAPDLESAKATGRLEEAQNRKYPMLNCGEIMAWGWGHSLVADYLETCNWAGELICTGHSRGGKAALCAGVMDDRFAVVAPIGSGCGGAGSARYLGTLDGSRQDPDKCETIGRMAHAFPKWMGPQYAEFGSKETPFPVGEETYCLPLDAHMLRAACAPRAVFSSEGTEDYWCNLFGTQLCWQAAQPVFDFLGVPERNGFNARPGMHEYAAGDWRALVDFCDIVFHRERPMPQAALNKPAIDLNVRDYAPWIRA